jgi:hypothetical protein
MLFDETMSVYCNNYTKHLNVLCFKSAELLIVKVQVNTLNTKF